MHALYHESVESDFGLFELRLSSSSAFGVEEPAAFETTLLTEGHLVTVRRTPAPTDWLPEGMSVARARAWLFYVQKRNTVSEQLTFSIKLAEPLGKYEAGPDTGEWLAAIEFEDGTHQLHIGTQDEDSYAWQAGSPWVPERLKQLLASGQDLIVTDIEPDGLTTRVPELRAGEQFYFHYIMAENPLRKSADYPDEQDISTWYVVEQRREKLEEAWQQAHSKEG